ncbi:hemolymph lipopolysaccharide-binding protein [Anabrus simplex]|uniref:hemolymph lipopolysaccharide-binding protein n=1 Tax=Anabrus simplex TaxID=316456 RepID=UPI0035A312DA
MEVRPVTTLFTILCLALRVEFFAAQACPGRGRHNMEICVTGQRNASGHWTFGVGFATKTKRLLQLRNPRTDIAFSLGNDVRYSEGAEQISMYIEATVKGPSPPKEYELKNGVGYYKLHTTALTWEDASDKCESEGARLMIINSEREANVAREYFVRKPAITNATNALYCHVGFHNRFIKGQYTTLDGKQFSDSGYVKWAPNQPKGGNHLCAVIDSTASFHDSLCHTWKFFFICEYPETFDS